MNRHAEVLQSQKQLSEDSIKKLQRKLTTLEQVRFRTFSADILILECALVSHVLILVCCFLSTLQVFSQTDCTRDSPVSDILSQPGVKSSGLTLTLEPTRDTDHALPSGQPTNHSTQDSSQV